MSIYVGCWIFSSIPLHYMVWNRSFPMGPELNSWLYRLVTKLRNPPVSVFLLLLPVPRYQMCSTTIHDQLLCGCWICELKSSCQYDTYFTDRTISPSPLWRSNFWKILFHLYSQDQLCLWIFIYNPVELVAVLSVTPICQHIGLLNFVDSKDKLHGCVKPSHSLWIHSWIRPFLISVCHQDQKITSKSPWMGGGLWQLPWTKYKKGKRHRFPKLIQMNMTPWKLGSTCCQTKGDRMLMSQGRT